MNLAGGGAKLTGEGTRTIMAMMLVVVMLVVEIEGVMMGVICIALNKYVNAWHV